MNRILVQHFATFTSGFILALSTAFGFNRLGHNQQQSQQTKQNQAQVQKLQTQNKALCQYFKQHKLKAPRGVVCR